MLILITALLALSDPTTTTTAAAATPKARLTRVAVADFEVSGVDADVGRVVTDATLTELRKLQGVSVVGMREIRAMMNLEAEKQSMGCDEGQSCLAEIAEALGVDVLVAGTLAHVGDDNVFGLRLIDQRQAAVGDTVNQRLVPAGGEEFLAAIGPAVEKLFPGVPLRPGVTRGVDEKVALRLHPPPLSPWIFWTGAGSTVVLVAATGVTGVLNASAASSYAAAVTAAQTEKTSFSALRTQQEAVDGLATTTVVLGSAAAVAAVATVGVFFFTDFAANDQGGADAHQE